MVGRSWHAEHVCSLNLTFISNNSWNKVNPVTHFGVISLFSSNFQHFNTFRPLFQKLLEINVKFKLETCSACQDLPTMQFWSKSRNPFWSYCMVGRSWHAEHVCSLNLTFISNSFWNKGRKCSACQDLPTMQFWSKSRNPFWSYFPFFIKFSTF
jgi:Zn ribbon nucleic-acid-binding protein